MSIKCGKCGNSHETPSMVKQCHQEFTSPNKKVIVTCGWGKDAHKWETTKGEAIAMGNTCPEHNV